MGVVVAAIAASVLSQPATVWEFSEFQTTSTTFVVHPEGPVTFATPVGTSTLIVMNGELVSTAPGSPAAEAIVGSAGSNSAWGRAAVTGVAAGTVVSWAFFDFAPGGMPQSLPVRVRSTLPGETATLRNLKVVVIPIPAAELRARETFAPVGVPSTWTPLVTVDGLRSGPWLFITTATGLDTADGGIALRLRTADGGTISRAAVDGGDRQFALLEGPGWPQAFLFANTPLHAGAVALEARSFDSTMLADGGWRALLTDVRLIAIELGSALRPALVNTRGPVVGLSPVVPIDASSSTADGGAYLLVQSVLAAPVSEGPVAVTLEGGGQATRTGHGALERSHTSVARAAVIFGGGPLVTMRVTVTAPDGGLVGAWEPVNGLVRITAGAERVSGLGDGGFVQLDGGGPADAGPSGDAGAATDAGRSTDAGAPDAAVVADAGEPDAGANDAGTEQDAGPSTADRGPRDAGDPAEGANLAVGCGCGASPASTIWLLLVLILSRWGSAGATSRRSA
jgi:hypothetical protein